MHTGRVAICAAQMRRLWCAEGINVNCNPIIQDQIYDSNSFSFITDLITKVYNRKQKQVLLHGLPLLYHLLGISSGSGAVPGSNGNIRLATVHLVQSLHSQMGEALMEHASSNTNVTPRHLQMLQDMINNP